MNALNTILTNLKDELLLFIQSTNNDYQTDLAMCVRGTTLSTDLIMSPAIIFYTESIEPTKNYGDGFYTATINLYGYTRATEFDNVDALYYFIDDCIYFLYNDWTHKDNTEVISVEISETGLDEFDSTFLITLEITYEYVDNTR